MSKNQVNDKYFSFDVNYNNCPDTFTYYFRAKSDAQVAKATGVSIDRISACSTAEIAEARRLGKHIDTVVRGRLVETA